MYRFRPIGVVLIAAAACAGGGPEPTSAPPPVTVVNANAPYTPADVAFMQGMILHHGQALDMTALVPQRTTDETLRLLAERIRQTQRDEIQRMEHWLADRGETVPAPETYRGHAGHAGHGGMPGMLTADQMARLERSTGRVFERLFLELMIQHHQGALVMVSNLQQAGGGLEAEIYRFAADVDADQRAEIARMRHLLNELQ